MASHAATAFLLAFCVAVGAFAAEKLVFSTQTHPSCPVLVSSAKASRAYAFQSAEFRNESRSAVESVRVVVTLSGTGDKELVESVSLAAKLARSESRRVELGLGNLRELYRKAKGIDQEFAVVVLSIESVQFADGAEWRAGEPLIYDPAR